VAGACQTEGEERDDHRSVSSPSVTFGATSPWRGRIAASRRHHPHSFSRNHFVITYLTPARTFIP
jgi:hypothetical protein